jgi:hypothetical protein
MQYLHRLTTTGLTIAAVIHQPRVEVFLGVDDVIFLGKGGRVAYYGPAREAVPYFKAQGYDFSPHVNPADRILDLISNKADPSDETLYVKWEEHLHSRGVNGRFGFWSPEVRPLNCLAGHSWHGLIALLPFVPLSLHLGPMRPLREQGQEAAGPYLVRTCGRSPRGATRWTETPAGTAARAAWKVVARRPQ